MANPTPYERAYSFAGFQANNPQKPLPGQKVDVELDNVERTTTDLISGLADIRRADGRLQNGIVTLDSLSAEVATGVQPAVAWTTLTQYDPGAVVFYNTGFYRALVSHVSGVFATDFAAGKWELFADLGPIVVDAGTARDQAVAAAGVATTQAGIATTGGTTATTQAGIATSAASAASGSASTASAAAGTATTQAGIATTQAGLATTAKNAAQAAAATVVNGFKVTQRFSAADGNLTAGQTSFTVPAYDTPYGYVYRNGFKLVNGVDVTFPTGTTFLLASGVGGSDVLEFEGFGVFNVANLAANQVAYSNASSGLTATNAQAAIDEVKNRIPAGARGNTRPAAKTTTSGTSHDYALTGAVKRVRAMFSGLSTNGSSRPIIQLGTGGAPTVSGYLSAVANLPDATSPATANVVNGAPLANGWASTALVGGWIEFALLDAATNTWTWFGGIGFSSGASEAIGGGSVVLAGALDFMRLTTAGGADAFDAGIYSIEYDT